MFAGKVPVGALLLVAVGSILFQAASAEDIYWEGEEDAANEFLEVKEEPWALGAALHRVRRGFVDWFLPSSTEAPEPKLESRNLISPAFSDENTNNDDGDDEEPDSNFGSGATPERDQEAKEKTLRVSFVAIEPYEQYSDRDSEQFQNLSKSLADAVNELYLDFPGVQRASLVRIQSRPADQISCKVTLDIATRGYDDLDRIAEALHQHILAESKLGNIIVKDTDFSAMPIVPDVVMPECAADEFHCESGHCVGASLRCNGYSDCADGSDEKNCAPVVQSTTPAPPLRGDDYNPSIEEIDTESDIEVDEVTPSYENAICTNPKTCLLSFTTYCPDKECDGVRDCLYGDDEENCDNTPETAECERDEMRCDDTRCVLLKQRCDGIKDCTDGKDEEGCKIGKCLLTSNFPTHTFQKRFKPCFFVL